MRKNILVFLKSSASLIPPPQSNHRVKCLFLSKLLRAILFWFEAICGQICKQKQLYIDDDKITMKFITTNERNDKVNDNIQTLLCRKALLIWIIFHATCILVFMMRGFGFFIIHSYILLYNPENECRIQNEKLRAETWAWWERRNYWDTFRFIPRSLSNRTYILLVYQNTDNSSTKYMTEQYMKTKY